MSRGGLKDQKKTAGRAGGGGAGDNEGKEGRSQTGEGRGSLAGLGARFKINTDTYPSLSSSALALPDLLILSPVTFRLDGFIWCMSCAF